MGFEVGSILEGTVTGITKFGAFVSLPDKRSGLVHISEIAHSYVNDIHEHLSEGQPVTVKVIGIDQSNRINLSIRQATPPPDQRLGNGARSRSETDHRPARRSASGSGFSSDPPQPKGSASFEDRLKQFMASSDSKLSELRMNERRSSRRGRK